MLSDSETSQNGVFWYKDKILPINRDLFASAQDDVIIFTTP
jgi:hypothetical protein